MTTITSLARQVAGYDRRQELRRLVRRFGWFGFSRRCPCCGSSLRRFLPAGLPPRAEAMCPVCGARERHRLIYLYLTQRTDLFDGRAKRMLHVAPELELSRLFRATTSIDYLSADLMSPHAMVKMDITDIRFPDATFDVIYCSHVLEHVPDDRKAMSEFYRVLKPGGWAVLQVPITASSTFEDPSVTSPEERERVFGQHDHVRRYGPDYRDRLAEAGFSVTVDPFARSIDQQLVEKYRVSPTEYIYFCRKVLDSVV